MAEDFVRESKDGVLLNLRVSPQARNTSLDGLYGGSALKVRISAPPTDGRANAELKDFLAGIFDVAPSKFEVVKGTSSRDKVVFVRGVREADIRSRLPGLLNQPQSER